MPVAPAGTSGFPDWARVVAWDTPIQWSATNQHITGPLGPPEPINAQSWANLAGVILVNAGQTLFRFLWDGTGTPTFEAGERNIPLGDVTIGYSAIRLSHLGPSLTPTVTPIGADAFVSFGLFSTNRPSPIETFPPFPQLVSVKAATLGAGLTAHNYANRLHAGPARVFVQTPATGWFLEAVSLDTAGNWDYFDYQALPAGNSVFDTVMPLASCDFQIVNTTGVAGSYYLSVTPSTTGGT